MSGTEVFVVSLRGAVRAAARYIAEGVVATAGAMVTGGLVAVAVERGPLRALSHVLAEPLWLGPVLAAGVFGYIVALRFGYRRASIFVWVIGVLNFGLQLQDSSAHIRRYGWDQSLWDEYFGRDCGDSECLSQLFATAPLYTSVAYSLAAGLCGLIGRGTQRVRGSKPGTT